MNRGCLLIYPLYDGCYLYALKQKATPLPHLNLLTVHLCTPYLMFCFWIFFSESLAWQGILLSPGRR